jgi:hypothetical protein
MRGFGGWWSWIAVALLPAGAAAESLRCENGIAAEGDSRLALVHKCGAPRLRDAYCAPAVWSGTLQPVPQPFAGLVVPCLPVEEWLYERGPGLLVATVRLQGGRITSISYGRSAE